MAGGLTLTPVPASDTAVGPGKPFDNCQGYILSAFSSDGVNFAKEPGIRLAPRPEVEHGSLRLLAPTVIAAAGGGWRMYVESRGNAAVPTVITSAFSHDMLQWEHEEGIRLAGQHEGVNVRGPRIHPLGPGSETGAVRLWVCDGDGHAASATSTDGLKFAHEPGTRLDCTPEGTHGSFSAVDVIMPTEPGGQHTMLFSAWTTGTEFDATAPLGELPPHPSTDPDAETNGGSARFAEVSIAHDMAGARSRIFVADELPGRPGEPPQFAT